MKKYFKLLWKKKLWIIIILLSSFLFGFTVSSLYNTYIGYYTIEFSANKEDVSFEPFLTDDYLNKIKDDFKKKDNTYYESINIQTILENKALQITKASSSSYILKTKSRYYNDFFIAKSKQVSTRAKTFYKQALNTYAQDNNFELTFSSKDILIRHTPINTTGLLIISFSSLFVGGASYLITLYLKLKKYDDILFKEKEYKNIYKTPFHKKYWIDACKVFTQSKNITCIAMLLGIMLICKAFSLPSGFGNLGISLTYLIFAISSMIYGPLAGILIGILSDTFGYFLFQSSQIWFIGYTLQSALAGFTYGLLFYKTEIEYRRVFIARIIVSFILNVIWGSICWGIIMNYSFDQTYFYALAFVLPKNIVYLIPQSIILYLLMKALAIPLARLDFIDEEQITTIRLKKEVIASKNKD